MDSSVILQIQLVCLAGVFEWQLLYEIPSLTKNTDFVGRSVYVFFLSLIG